MVNLIKLILELIWLPRIIKYKRRLERERMCDPNIMTHLSPYYLISKMRQNENREKYAEPEWFRRQEQQIAINRSRNTQRNMKKVIDEK